MINFLKEMCIESDAEHNYPAHQPGATVVYSGKDGLKYYVILERIETPITEWSKEWYSKYKPHVDTNELKDVSLEVAMIANPKLDIASRKQIRDFSACSVKVLDLDNWQEIQANFFEHLTTAAADRFADHQ